MASTKTSSAPTLPKKFFDACPEQTLRIAKGLQVKLHAAPDMDDFLDFYAETQGDNADAIPYYAIVWEGARALAKHLASRFPSMAGKSVIELGCGLGLPSIVAAKLGADVSSTDFHPDCGAFLKRNADDNNVDINFMSLDWRAPPNDIGKFDIVMASDVLYDAAHSPHLVNVATHLIKRNGTIIIADPGRSGLQSAMDLFTEKRFSFNLFPTNDVFVFELAHN